MDVFEALRTRRDIGKLKAETPPRDFIEKILEAGTWAPNHHLTQPWRFFVLTGEALNRLGEARAQALMEELDDPDSATSSARLDKERIAPLRAPVMIAVAISPSDNPIVEEVEEIEAVAMAVQNMLLAAHALGLGAMLRTGKAAYRKKVKEFFGVTGKERLFGFIHLGYPDMAPPERTRSSFAEKTKWLQS